MMARINDLTGQRFERLVVASYSHSNQNGRAVWNCICDCGNTLTVKGNALLSGNTKSCGCLKADCAANMKYRHGQRNSRLYRIWSGMMTRCNNPHFHEYARYGGRGISVCLEWQDFALFHEWATGNGYSDDLSLDRIDNNGNYCPENCRWVTRQVQANNTSRNHYLTFNGETHTMSEWATITGIAYFIIRERINKFHWSVEKALTTPTKEKAL